MNRRGFLSMALAAPLVPFLAAETLRPRDVPLTFDGRRVILYGRPVYDPRVDAMVPGGGFIEYAPTIEIRVDSRTARAAVRRDMLEIARSVKR